LTITLSCAPVRWQDELYVGYIPNSQLLNGIFVNSFSNQDTLVIAANMFFLLTRDSIGKSLVIRGKCFYGDIVSDAVKNGPGGLELYPQSERSIWSSGVHFQDSTKYTKLLVLDTLWGYYRFAPNEHAWDFKKDKRLDSLSRLPRVLKLNSIGRPYRFERKLVEFDGRYY
jgi:hypothetical protein